MHSLSLSTSSAAVILTTRATALRSCFLAARPSTNHHRSKTYCPFCLKAKKALGQFIQPDQMEVVEVRVGVSWGVLGVFSIKQSGGARGWWWGCHPTRCGWCVAVVGLWIPEVANNALDGNLCCN